MLPVLRGPKSRARHGIWGDVTFIVSKARRCKVAVPRSEAVPKGDYTPWRDHPDQEAFFNICGGVEGECFGGLQGKRSGPPRSFSNC